MEFVVKNIEQLNLLIDDVPTEATTMRKGARTVGVSVPLIPQWRESGKRKRNAQREEKGETFLMV